MIELFDGDKLVFKDNTFTTTREVVVKDGIAYVFFQRVSGPGEVVTRHRAQSTMVYGGQCKLPIRGWWCSRGEGHSGPCAARKRWWNWL